MTWSLWQCLTAVYPYFRFKFHKFDNDDVIKWKHFRVTAGPLWWESTGHRWIPLTKANDAEPDIFFDLHLDKRLSKQSRCRWFGTPSCSIWRHSNDSSAYPDLVPAVVPARPYKQCDVQYQHCTNSGRHWQVVSDVGEVSPDGTEVNHVGSCYHAPTVGGSLRTHCHPAAEGTQVCIVRVLIIKEYGNTFSRIIAYTSH